MTSLVGNNAAIKIEKKLHQYFDPSQVEIALPDKKDFGAMTKDEIVLWNQKGHYLQVA